MNLDRMLEEDKPYLNSRLKGFVIPIDIGNINYDINVNFEINDPIELIKSSGITKEDYYEYTNKSEIISDIIEHVHESINNNSFSNIKGLVLNKVVSCKTDNLDNLKSGLKKLNIIYNP